MSKKYVEQMLLLPASIKDKLSIIRSLPSSAIEISASVYWRPFWMMLKRAAGGTSDPFMLLIYI